MKSLLDRVLDPGGLRVAFQPILDVSRDGSVRVFGFEGLSRGPSGTNLERADVLFDYVRRKREEIRVDRACIRAALTAARELPRLPLFLNVHASTLARDFEFGVFLADTAVAAGIDLDRLVVEIVEHAPPWDTRSFLNAIEGLRAVGVKIALDDIGLGESNYRMILDCRPDYFKIDGYFTQGCRLDHYRQAVLDSVRQLAARFGARVIAEAVEEVEDLAAVRSLGIELVQGFCFVPALAPAEASRVHFSPLPPAEPARLAAYA